MEESAYLQNNPNFHVKLECRVTHMSPIQRPCAQVHTLKREGIRLQRETKTEGLFLSKLHFCCALQRRHKSNVRRPALKFVKRPFDHHM